MTEEKEKTRASAARTLQLVAACFAAQAIGSGSGSRLLFCLAIMLIFELAAPD